LVTLIVKVWLVPENPFMGVLLGWVMAAVVTPASTDRRITTVLPTGLQSESVASFLLQRASSLSVEPSGLGGKGATAKVKLQGAPSGDWIPQALVPNRARSRLAGTLGSVAKLPAKDWFPSLSRVYVSRRNVLGSTSLPPQAAPV
jgi:hypothetical protein